MLEEEHLNVIEIKEKAKEEKTENAIVSKWMQLFQEEMLASGHFREHWRVWVPKAFLPPNKGEKGYEWEVKEDIVQNVLISSLEEFISDGNTPDFFSYLSNHNVPPSVCGKVFKMGEPSYNCRDCSTDVTCVLCVNCFKQSPHRYHKYKMGTSMGGGCCDCGDVEAWKSDPYCEDHIAGLKERSEDSDEFSTELVKRAECVFNAVLQYCSEILTLDYYPGLPRNLRLREDEDPDVDMELYCILLYDHESYTFEEVVSALATVLNCSHRQALEYVTCIDREGRAIIKCSSYQHCHELKQNIERVTSRHGGRPLETLVVQSQVVAHQMFALRLLNWLLKLTNLSKGFRKIFTCTSLNLKSLDEFLDSEQPKKDLVHEYKSDPAFVEVILLQDSFLWKIARLHWHRLFISGMFMEYENKKAFAKVFTNHYCAILKNFIREDHDYSFSFASLSIQMFTVPTLALHLIAHEDVLYKLLNTFVAECSRKRNEAGTLEFSRGTSLGAFRRALNILHDLRYLLHSPPDVWTCELRRGFLKGVTMMLNLFTYMQGMNAAKRQVGQHMEYEPEWEAPFALQNKLAPVITLILKWCSTDQIVFMKVYRLTLKKLFEYCCHKYKDVEEEVEVDSHKAVCYKYDISTEPVSIHIPLTRYLAGLFLLLDNFGFSFYSEEFISLKKPTLQQIIEPVLRTQVLIAQVQAGLWRKNGYSMSNQIFYYHTVKCRREMHNKDIILLQFVASLIDSNEFLILLINKFKLLDWAHPEFETTFFNHNPAEFVKTSPKVVEEFLTLLVILISDRYIPGVGRVTSDDCLKNDIIHQLFMRPLSHSELNKTLPDDVNHHETGMENVIEEVANFKKPTSTSGKGVYVVKEEFVNKFNVFYKHYSKEDMSKAEEEQRKVRKKLTGFECCPPPVLPRFSPTFEPLLNLLQSDILLYILKIVLERHLDVKARGCTEGQLHAVLHLIGHALQEQELDYTIEKFTNRAEKWGILNLLEELSNNYRSDAHRDLIKWTLDKYRTVAYPKESEATREEPSSLSQMEVDDQVNDRLARSKLAAEKKAAILAQMAMLQQNFLKQNAALFHIDVEESSVGTKQNMSRLSPLDSEDTVSLGYEQWKDIEEQKTVTCILCQEEQIVKADGPALILASFLQKSTVLVRRRAAMYKFDDFLSANIGPAVHLSTCGHIMHISCWKKYINTVISKQCRRPYRLLKQPMAFDIEKNEYLCPLCLRLCNTVLPILPMLSTFNKSSRFPEEIPFRDWYDIALIIMEQSIKNEESSLTSIKCDSNLNISCLNDECDQIKKLEDIKKSEDLENELVRENEISKDPKKEMDKSKLSIFRKQQKNGGLVTSRCFLEVVNLFTEACCKHEFHEKTSWALEDRYLRTWKSCAYTIHSLEWLHRHTDKSLLGDFTLREQECLENIIRLSGVVGLIIGETDSLKKICYKILSRLFNHESKDSILELDCLGIMIPLSICMPGTYYSDVLPLPLGKTIEKHCFQAALLCHFAQTIICTDLSDYVFLPDGDVTSEDTECLAEIVRIMKDCQGIDTSKIWDILKKASISFLRCSVIYFHFLTGVPAPKSLKELGGDTYENMMRFLGMPTNCKDLLGDACVLAIFREWAKHPHCVLLRHQVTVREMVPMNGLVKLSEDYSEIINSATGFTCPNSESEDVRNPAMCLVCGQMLCSETYCCQGELEENMVGACTFHAQTCGSGVGLFLRIRDCEVLLIAGLDRGCFLPAPYLDDYGEADQGLKRGHRMHFNEERYKELLLMWLSHGIYEHVAWSIEQNISIIQTQWHHL